MNQSTGNYTPAAKKIQHVLRWDTFFSKGGQNPASNRFISMGTPKKSTKTGLKCLHGLGSRKDCRKFEIGGEIRENELHREILSISECRSRDNLVIFLKETPGGSTLSTAGHATRLH